MNVGPSQEIPAHVENLDSHPSVPNDAAKGTSHTVQVIQPGDHVLLPVVVCQDTTVGSITAAVGSMDQPIRINTCVGTPIAIADVAEPMQQIFLRTMNGCGIDHSCTQGVMAALLHTAHVCTRPQVLYHQEGWVAQDEMNFYLRIIQGVGTSRVAEGLVMPEHTLDEEMEPMLQRWIGQVGPHPLVLFLQAGAITICNSWGACLGFVSNTGLG